MVLIPDEAHPPQSSESSHGFSFLPSGHTPACHFPRSLQSNREEKLLKISLNIHLPKMKHQLLKNTIFFVIKLFPLAWHDLLSSPLVSSVNSSPILNDIS